MPESNSAELKKRLRAEGFEIYRTRSDHVQLAERVRDNLIMDSGVAVTFAPDDAKLAVRVTVRAQASHFPGADEAELQAQAQRLAAEFVTAGYTAEQVLSTPVPDPSHPEESLDTSHEVRLSMPVPNSTALILELKRAMERRRYTSDE